MEAQDINKIIKEALCKMQREKKYSLGECLPEEMIAAYIDHTLSGSLVENVEYHLAECPACRQVVIDLGRIKQPVLEKDRIISTYLEKLTRSILEKAGALKNALEISLIWIKGQLTLHETNGKLNLNLAPSLVRTTTAGLQDSVAPITKKFSECEVSVQINGYNKDNLCEVWVTILGDTIQEAPLRLELIRDQQILQSHPIKKGKIKLEEIPPAHYTIRIRKRQKTIANLYLHIDKD
ncbi:MAG: anti-sigma factor family protein [bacterium]